MAGATKENIPGGSSGATKPDGLFPENPLGGGSFVRGRRWLVPYSPLRGCAELAALATAKIPRRSAPRSFQTGSSFPYQRDPTIGSAQFLTHGRQFGGKNEETPHPQFGIPCASLQLL